MKSSIFNFFKIIYIVTKWNILDHRQMPLTFSLKITSKLLRIVLTPYSFFQRSKSYEYRLRNALQELGPIYIKFGQLLSTRPDLIGEKITKELSLLQDTLPAFPTNVAIKILEDSLEKPISKIFMKIDSTPVAAGSVAQVYKATLHNGDKVAVKILRPNVKNQYFSDINLLLKISAILSYLTPKIKRLNPKSIVNILHNAMKHELDLKLEAAACSKMSLNFSSNCDIYFPKIHWSYTSENVLVTEWIDGFSIYDKEQITQNKLNPRDLAAKIAVMSFQQTYQDGFFHADLHPGNIIITKNGMIGLIDFGIMGILPNNDRLAVAEILFGFIKKDYDLVARVHKKAGYLNIDMDSHLFAQYCRSIGEPIVGLAVKDISIGKLLLKLFKITEEFGMEVQPQLILLQKTMIIIEGIGQTLDPNINIWKLIEPWIMKWATRNISPEAKLAYAGKNKLLQFFEYAHYH